MKKTTFFYQNVIDTCFVSKTKLFLSFTLLICVICTAQITQIGNSINGEAAQDFSGSVAMSANGNIIAVGAHSNDGNGNSSGHVRVFENINSVWTQIGSDIDGEAVGDRFGVTIAMSSDGSIVAVSATFNDGVNGTDSGHVRVFENVNNTWIQIGSDIDGEAEFDFSGRSISLSSDGTVLSIGSLSNDATSSNQTADIGHVRVYENINNVWTQIGNDIDGEFTNDFFGISSVLSADGNTVAIGAQNNDNGGVDAGYVRVFENVNAVWTQVGNNIEGITGDLSGSVISMSSNGTIIALGATGNDNNGMDSGTVRVFENINGTWTQIGNDIDGEAPFDNSGAALDMSSDGTIVAISAFRNDANGVDSGHVRVYQNQSNTWVNISGDIDGNASNDFFGGSISLSSDGLKIAIGAVGADTNGTNSGQVKVFELNALSSVTHYVKPTATGTGDGTSWADASGDLQDVINTSTSGDKIFVAKGTYIPNRSIVDLNTIDANNRDNAFVIKDGIEVYGGFDPDNGISTLADTRIFDSTGSVLSGDFNGDDKVTGSGSTLSISDNTENAYHVVVFNQNPSATTIDGFTIKGGNADDINFGIVAGVTRTNGAGMVAYLSPFSIISNITFTENRTIQNGGGLFLRFSSANISNTIFNKNIAAFGGGLYTTSSGSSISAVIVNSIFHDNKSEGNGFVSGSAIFSNAGNIEINNSVITRNHSNNTNTGGASIANFNAVALSIYNSILWDNTIGNTSGNADIDIEINSSTTVVITVANCLTEFYGTNGVDGIIRNQNPLFIDAANENFALQAGSPVIDAGDNTKVPTGITTDILGNQRIFNTTVDMGAYEFGSSPALSVNDFNTAVNKIKLYPNPVTATLNIETTSHLKQATIYSVLGAEVLSTTSKTINTSNLKTGIYLIKIEDEIGTILTKRFIKQ